MNTQFDNPHLPVFTKNWGWFLVAGIVLIILGVIAIAFSAFTTLISVLFIAALILGSGIVIIIDSFISWWGKGSGFFLHLLLGILYTIVGIALLKSPILASISLTLLLAVLYIVVGIVRIFYSITVRAPQWGWNFFSGLIAALLGILILSEWPVSGLFIIGLFVGIDLLVAGWVYVLAAFSGRKLGNPIRNNF